MQTTLPPYANNLREGWSKIVSQEGYGGLYKGLYPLWARQIPYTMVKFATFESAVAQIYAQLGKPKEAYNTLQQTGVSFLGGYIAGVLFGRHPMAPVISPKKSWEGFVGSLVFCVAAGVALVVYLLDGDWWVGVALGLIAVVMATLGDLCESVIKRDLGIKDMSQVIPGHGGLMDRLDSLLATIAPVWLLLHYLVFV